MQKTGERAGLPIDGNFASPQNEAGSTLMVHSYGSLRTSPDNRLGKQVHDREGLGYLHVHSNLTDTHGDSRVLLDKVIFDGLKEVHSVVSLCSKVVPVRSGNAVGGCFQVDGSLGLEEGP
jgi:hypothetical protein